MQSSFAWFLCATDPIAPRMDARLDQFITKLRDEDAELTRLYDSGIIDGYSAELLC